MNGHIEYLRRRGFAMLWAVACHPRMFVRMLWINRHQTGKHKWIMIGRFIQQMRPRAEWEEICRRAIASKDTEERN